MDRLWFVEKLIGGEWMPIGHPETTRAQARMMRNVQKALAPAASFRVRRYQRVEESK